MPCPTEDTIIRFITEEISPEQAEKINDHISQCKKCRDILQEYTELNKIMAKRALPKMPKNFHRTIVKRLFRQKSVKLNTLMYFPWIKKTMALTVMLLIFIAGIQTGRHISMHKQTASSMLNPSPSIDSYLVSTQTLFLDYSNLNSNSSSIDEQNNLTIKTAEAIYRKTKIIKSLINDDNRELITLITEIENLLEEMIQSKEADSNDLENLIKQELANSQILLRISRYTS